MNNINVTLELCAEDRARLEHLIAEVMNLSNKVEDAAKNANPIGKATEALKNLTSKAKEAMAEKPIQEAAETPVTPATEEPAKEKPEAEKPAETEPAKPEEASEPKITAAEIRALVQKLVAPGTGKRDATKAIVMQYAANVSDIPADKYTEVYEKLKALEVGA